MTKDIDKTQIIERIKQLKEEKDAVILAHYYVNGDVQDIADYIGDSFFLSKKAVEDKHRVIIFAGVKFMGESAKLLNKDKKVIMSDDDADCPMAHMASKEDILRARNEHNDLAVVCYINSTCELKKYSDVCVTSANAEKVVKALPNKNIFFIPDKNLGRYVAKNIPEKNFYFNSGFCPTHYNISKNDVLKAKRKHPNALVIAHPECRMDVVDQCDFVGSTSQLIKFTEESPNNEFIVVTECGVLHEMKKRSSNKNFYSVGQGMVCPNMKRTTLEGILDKLEHLDNEVILEEDMYSTANKCLEKMLELAK